MKNPAAKLRQIVEAGDESKLEDLVGESARYCLKRVNPADGVFPEDLFAAMLQTVESPAFKRMEGGYHLLLWFEFDWGRLSPDQTARLLPVLEAAYGEFSDWMCRVVASEILGRFFADAAALDAVERLNASLPEEARATLPMAFEKFVVESADPAVKARAATRLLELARDPSGEIQTEVRESLQRLKNQGVTLAPPPAGQNGSRGPGLE